MKEMLQARKEELQKKGKKGFTLMEMLIVIAIIAVLVAIAIPVFTAQLDKANAQTDAANIRSGYAVAMATVLSDNKTGTSDTIGTLQADGTVVKDGATNAYKCKGNASAADANETIGGVTASSIAWQKDSTITYSWTASTDSTPGSLSIVASPKAS